VDFFGKGGKREDRKTQRSWGKGEVPPVAVEVGSTFEGRRKKIGEKLLRLRRKSTTWRAGTGLIYDAQTTGGEEGSYQKEGGNDSHDVGLEERGVRRARKEDSLVTAKKGGRIGGEGGESPPTGGKIYLEEDMHSYQEILADEGGSCAEEKTVASSL